MIRRTRGFTFIELLVVVLVMSILSSLALLKWIDLKHRALSASATADLQAVRLAAYSAWYEHGVWPAEEGAGTVPGGLVPYLPSGFEFARPDYTLDWDNFVPPGGGPSGAMQLGVVVSTGNARLMRALQTSLGSKAPFLVVGGTLTFVIVGPDGRI
ncbi:MAG TPA: type II secretion system protein [Gemmatimonadales bacterium]|jgi:prepilin-type N-terminal cleavage/methylation domain-containing protein|nr:type II secretion system protein [Gemmatimonadales bacterium]